MTRRYNGIVKRPEPKITEHTLSEYDKELAEIEEKKKTLNFLGFCYSDKCLNDTKKFHTYSDTKPEDFIIEWSTISNRYVVWKKRTVISM